MVEQKKTSDVKKTGLRTSFCVDRRLVPGASRVRARFKLSRRTDDFGHEGRDCVEYRVCRAWHMLSRGIPMEPDD